MDRIHLVLPFILIAMFADFMDGLIARVLKVNSPIGKDLDSLSDMVSFGVVPAFLLIYLNVLTSSSNTTNNFIDELRDINSLQKYIYFFFPLIVALFSALRLAKFNIAEDQSKEFKGLATPAACLFVLGLFYNYINDSSLFNFIYNPLYLNISSLLLALLLVSNLSMFSFKLSNFSFKENAWQIMFIVGGITLLIAYNLSALPLIIILYLVLNIFKKLMK